MVWRSGYVSHILEAETYAVKEFDNESWDVQQKGFV
jgi:hypothetical protein